MTVSVVIPTYNEEKYINTCLECLMKQSVKPDEIILVDNNCTDKTIKIAKNYPVYVVKERKQGISYSRNKGFNTAQFEIIARCDADTRPPKNWIKIIKRNFEQRKIDALTGPAYFYDFPFKTTFYYKTLLDFMNLMMGNHTLNGFNMAISKKFWNKVKNILCEGDIEVHEDQDLAIHIVQKEGKIRIDDALLVGTSARRLKNNPLSAFAEYPKRGVLTAFNHRI